MTSTLARITLFSFLFLLFIPHLTSAETRTFIKEYNYQASEYDSKVSCRVLALEQVKRLLLEDIGTYLESVTEVKNFQMTKDQITVLSAGIVKTQIEDERWDGKTFYLRAKISADTEELTKSLDILRNNLQLVKELEDLRKRSLDMSNEVVRLRTALDNIANSNKNESPSENEQRIIKQYESAVDELAVITEDENSFFFKKIITLKEDERIITTVNANLFRGFEAVGGRMKITNKRLIFESHRLNVQDGPTAILLNQIAEVKKKNFFLGIVPTGMVIRAKNGTKYTFVVDNREELINLISSLLK